MPDYWYNLHKCVVRDKDDAATAKEKRRNMEIVASNKPYFMIYVYPQLKSKAKTYFKNNDYGAILRFKDYGIKSITELIGYEPKTPEMVMYLDSYYRYMPVGINDCVVNRICHIFEHEFDSCLSKKYEQPEFDYSIMKSDVGYSKKVFSDIKDIFNTYIEEMNAYKKTAGMQKDDPDYDIAEKYHRFAEKFRTECEKRCSNEDELCDIVLDLCYQTSKTKQFAWDVCGDKILENLLKKSNNTIHIPVHVETNGDFEYCGEQFEMREVVIGGGDNDCTE